MLEAALKYLSKGYSVIPIGPNKKPLIKWKPFQRAKADPIAINGWFCKWPDANIGIVTGEISGVNVIDVDSQAGLDVLGEFLPETFEAPISATPRGQHYWFLYQKGLSNGVEVLKGCDLRTDGGYVVVPPSKNSGKCYKWLVSLDDARLAPMPELLFDVLSGPASPRDTSASSSEHFKKDVSLYKKEYTSKSETNPKQFSETSETNRNTRNISFEKGSRDDSLFHTLTCLHRGGLAPENINKIAHFLGANCSPSFPVNEIEAKLQSVFSRAASAEMGLTEQLRAFISETWGNFSVTEAQQNVTSETSHNIRAKIRSILSRLFRNEGIIEPIPHKSGWYRKVESDCQPVDWQNASTDTVKLWLPFDLDKIAMIPPGSIISIAGEPNSGKTAVCMNIARYNFDKWNIHYFSSEMGSGAFKRRVALFPDILVENFKVHFYPRADQFSDVIKKGEGNLNIIDYLEITKDFYLVGSHLKSIYDKLCGAVAVVALQKSPGQELGRGGSFSIEKPVLSLSLSSGTAKITKLKEWSGDFNPNKMQYKFKLMDGCRFKKELGWHHPIKEE